MVNAISSSQLQQIASSEHAKHAQAPAQKQPQDTVQLSAAAQKAIAGGDVDHDGDNH
jgi:anti-sigma28 factor (negative regulator of flagellin synthesis)